MGETALSTTSRTERIRRFVQAFNRLAVALREPVDDVEALNVKVELYRTALDPLPIEAVEEAAIHLARTATWFPKTSEWYAAAEEAVAVRLRKLIPQARVQPWHYEHHESRVGNTFVGCNDTGWQRAICEAGARCGRAYCEQQSEAYTHDYVTVCSCRVWNATWRRTHEVMEGAK